MGQGSTLSPILSALYIALLICIFELRAQALNLDTCILSFVDDGLLISQEKTYNKTLSELYSSYRVVTNLMVMFSLVIEHDESEIFHFSRMHNDLNLKLNLSAIGALTLKPKIYWRYLGFYFDWYLSFKEHVWYYSTKALSMVKVVGMLGNSSRGLLPLQKHFLYCFCVVLICYMQVHLSRNYIPVVISSPNHTSPSSMAATFLTTHFMVVLQPSRYFVFHSRDTSIQLGLPWWSYSY